jgi:hypothetical protein
MSYKTKECAKGYTPGQLRAMAKELCNFLQEGKKEVFYDPPLYRASNYHNSYVWGLGIKEGREIIAEARKYEELADAMERAKFKE